MKDEILPSLHWVQQLDMKNTNIYMSCAKIRNTCLQIWT